MAKRETPDPFTQYRGQQTIVGAAQDRFGNAAGNQYDLAKDGGFQGARIAVLHLYTGEGFNFGLPTAALVEKGFVVERTTSVPDVDGLERLLASSCQLWIISGPATTLTAEHVAAIKAFFDSGRGVYLWGDNSPYFGDANLVAAALFGGGEAMSGYVPGECNLSLAEDGPGFASHDVTTGIQSLYEGHTVAVLANNPELRPIARGSSGDLLIAMYDRGGKRALVDGGFTRLYLKWDTAGTARYVKNAAAWLANFDHRGAEVFGQAPLSRAHPGWLRLVVPDSDCAVTIRATGGTRELSRHVGKTLLASLADSLGVPFYKYISREAPILEFALDETVGWQVRVPVESGNGFLLDGNALDGNWKPIGHGSRLVPYSKKQARALSEIQLEIQLPKT